MGYSPWGLKELDMTEVTVSIHACTLNQNLKTVGSALQPPCFRGASVKSGEAFTSIVIQEVIQEVALPVDYC